MEIEFGEQRFRAWGEIDGRAHCFAFTTRGGRIRAISLRRAHQKEWTVMSRKPQGFDEDDIVFDEDNPEWTKEDFERARPAHEVLPPEVLRAFPKLRGPQKTPTKVAVSLRLSREVVDHFKDGGPGWQTRIDDALKDLIKKAG